MTPEDPTALVLAGSRTAFVAHGDCRKRLKELPDNSVDAVVTDPPAGIAFMGKAWDRMQKEGMTELQAFQEFIFEVFTEVYRVLKPGGHAVVWALPRTAHHTTMGVERAGFEIRDVVHHLFGTGFPKSLDVSKAIAKRAGGEIEARKAVVWMQQRREGLGLSRQQLDNKIFGKSDGNVRNWEDGISLPKPGLWPKIRAALGVDSTPYDDAMERGDMVVGTEDGNYGYQKSGERWEEARIIREASTTIATDWQGWGTALKPAAENWILARKPLIGTVVANVLEHGTGALNIDACRIAAKADDDIYAKNPNTAGGFGHADATVYGSSRGAPVYDPSNGRWPANFVLSHSDGCVQTGEAWDCVPECAVRMLDEQSAFKNGSGTVKVPSGTKRAPATTLIKGMGTEGRTNTGVRDFGDSGGASRFFYVAKAPGAEKSVVMTCGCTPNLKIKDIPVISMKEAKGQAGQPCPVCGEEQQLHAHPTVKSVSLMEWLVKLVTPPGGVVLDPFTGSGTTGVAAQKLGFRFLGMEQDKVYCALARSRTK